MGLGGQKGLLSIQLYFSYPLTYEECNSQNTQGFVGSIVRGRKKVTGFTLSVLVIPMYVTVSFKKYNKGYLSHLSPPFIFQHRFTKAIKAVISKNSHSSS